MSKLKEALDSWGQQYRTKPRPKPTLVEQGCRAYRTSGQMLCPCGLAVDLDELDSVKCPRTGHPIKR